MIVEEPKQPSMPFDGCIERGQFASPPPVGGYGGCRELKRRGLGGSGKTHGKQRLRLVANKLALHGQALTNRRQAFHEGEVNSLPPC